MYKKLVITICFVFMISVMMFGQEFQMDSFKNASSTKQQLMYNMQYDNTYPNQEDTVRYEYSKSPAKAFFFSMLLPGAGELYAGKWGRAAGFFGIEVLLWATHFSKKSEGEDLEKKYKKFADAHWDMDKWLQETTWEKEGLGPKGTHQIWAILRFKNESGGWTTIDESAYEIKGDFSEVKTKMEEIKAKYSNGRDVEFVPLKTRDYYENIGKYKQFYGGWDDGEGVIVVDGVVKKVLSKNRNKYINKREQLSLLITLSVLFMLR